MAIKITENGKKFLNNTLFKRLSPYGLTEVEVSVEVVEPLIEALEKTKRRVEISEEDFKILADRHRRKFPKEGNFRNLAGKIVVERNNGRYFREYYSEVNILKGWHRDTINTIKTRRNIPFASDMGRIIFEIGQELIMTKDKGFYQVEDKIH